MGKVTYDTGFGNKAAVPKVDAKTCNLCGLCVDVCGSGLRIKDGAVIFDPDALIGCMGCGQCMAVCPSGSITITGRRMSPEMRVSMPAPRDIAKPEQLEALLLRRRSVRIFSKKEVEKPAIDAILRMTSTAPMGIPPSDVEILVLNGRKKVAEFRNDVMDYFKAISKYPDRALKGQVTREMIRDFIKPTLDDYLSGRENDADPLFFNCPLLLVFHSGQYAYPADPLIAATYAMIAAESLGLGTCMSGMVPFADGSSKIRRKYAIPKGNSLALGLIIGYPGIKYKWALRRDFASVVYR